MSEWHSLGPLAEIPEQDARGYTIHVDGRRRKVVVARWEGDVHAYLNICPHAGTPLNLMPEAFLDPTRQYLYCQTHAALFEVADGFCVDGPCVGDRLTRVPVAVDEDGALSVQV